MSGIGSGATFTGGILVAMSVYFLHIEEIEATLFTLLLLVVLSLGYYLILFRNVESIAEARKISHNIRLNDERE